MFHIISILLSVSLFTTNVSAQDYIIGPNITTFDDAEAYCNSQGRSLVTITDSLVNDEIKVSCETHYNSNESEDRGCWIGLYHDDATSTWKWTDGSSIDYGFDSNGNPSGSDPWHPGEPNSDAEDCIHFHPRLSYNWNDTPCSAMNLPICGSLIAPTIDPTTNPTANPSRDPTSHPTIEPSTDPTTEPTKDPTKDPTSDPTNDPTIDPTTDPTIDPTAVPTIDPSLDPTSNPTQAPSNPTKDPTIVPTRDPIDSTQHPTTDPTADPTTTNATIKQNSSIIYYVIAACATFGFIAWCFISVFIFMHKKKNKLMKSIENVIDTHTANSQQVQMGERTSNSLTICHSTGPELQESVVSFANLDKNHREGGNHNDGQDMYEDMYDRYVTDNSSIIVVTKGNDQDVINESNDDQEQRMTKDDMILGNQGVIDTIEDQSDIATKNNDNKSSHLKTKDGVNQQMSPTIDALSVEQTGGNV